MKRQERGERDRYKVPGTVGQTSGQASKNTPLVSQQHYQLQ